MDELKVLIIGHSPLLADVIEPKLASLLPNFKVQAVLKPMDALPEMEQGRVIASLAFVQEPADESVVAALLHDLQSNHLVIPVFVITSEDDVYQRLRFFEWGAVDCQAWPIDLSRLAALIDVLAVRRRIDSPVPSARTVAAVANNAAICLKPVRAAKPASRVDPSHRVVAGFVFASRALRELYDHIEAAADSDASVLLTGETGTGKSHVSRAIHDLSPRRKNPFVVVECGGLSPTLLESELFGHVRGAFTGADRDHVGKFAVVEDGTILLDEIDCVPLEAQSKLLRVFEDRIYEPVGSNRTAKFRARVIAATNQPLDRLAAEGKFRPDLFYRLNVVEFGLPPLRDCREAIGPLAENFLNIYCQRAKRSIDGISFAALESMLAYDWPGNIRELRNTLERAVTLCRNEVLDVADLPEAIRKAAALAGQRISVAVLGPVRNELDGARQSGERQRIVQALAKHDNNRTRAAKELGISRVALYKKLRKFGLVESPA
jgi:DNA-binding NtrC family response regulator